jgi:hypothetical protein
MITLRQLRFLSALAEYGHFGRASPAAPSDLRTAVPAAQGGFCGAWRRGAGERGRCRRTGEYVFCATRQQKGRLKSRPFIIRLSFYF